MPYYSEWVEPEVFIEHNGVTVYRVYKNDNLDEGVRSYWFTVDPENTNADETSHGDGGSFDVRHLGGYVNDDSILPVIRAAIDNGRLTQDGVVVPASSSENA